MDQLAQYMNKWSLSNARLLAQTHTSTVYLVERQGERVVVKLLNEVGVRDEKRGSLALRYYDGQGAVRLFDATDDAHLLEYLDGDDLISLVKAGDDDKMANITANVISTLHQKREKMRPSELHTLHRRFRSLFQLAETTSDETFLHGAQVAEYLLATEQNIVVLHGDIHPWNIRHSKRGWVAFDPKGLLGENAYDVANALLNPVGMSKIVNDDARFLRHTQIYADALGIPQQRVIQFAFAHACLSVSWSMEDEDDYIPDLITAKMMENHLSV